MPHSISQLRQHIERLEEATRLLDSLMSFASQDVGVEAFPDLPIQNLPGKMVHDITSMIAILQGLLDRVPVPDPERDGPRIAEYGSSLRELVDRFLTEVEAAKFSWTFWRDPVFQQANRRFVLLHRLLGVHEGETERIFNEEGGTPPSATERAFASASDLAARHGVDQEALRKRLDRFRRQSFGPQSWIENAERGPRDPKYLYSMEAAAPIIESLKARKASAERPLE